MEISASRKAAENLRGAWSTLDAHETFPELQAESVSKLPLG